MSALQKQRVPSAFCSDYVPAFVPFPPRKYKRPDIVKLEKDIFAKLPIPDQRAKNARLYKASI